MLYCLSGSGNDDFFFFFKSARLIVTNIIYVNHGMKEVTLNEYTCRYHSKKLKIEVYMHAYTV